MKANSGEFSVHLSILNRNARGAKMDESIYGEERKRIWVSTSFSYMERGMADGAGMV